MFMILDIGVIFLICINGDNMMFIVIIKVSNVILWI